MKPKPMMFDCKTLDEAFTNYCERTGVSNRATFYAGAAAFFVMCMNGVDPEELGEEIERTALAALGASRDGHN